MKIGILQPGRLGDIIICLPIAKFYYDKGYEIIWPVVSYCYNIFRDIDYVHAIDLNCSIDQSVSKSKSILNKFSCEIIDMSFGFPGSDLTNKYHNNTTFAENFVLAKYKLANTPIEERWRLQFNRDHEKENSLYERVVSTSKYKLVHLCSSQGRHGNIHGSDIVEVTKIEGFNIFNWMKVIEHATEIYCVDSVICNLVESQKHLKSVIKNYISKKLHATGWGRTTLNNNWIII